MPSPSSLSPFLSSPQSRPFKYLRKHHLTSVIARSRVDVRGHAHSLEAVTLDPGSPERPDLRSNFVPVSPEKAVSISHNLISDTDLLKGRRSHVKCCQICRLACDVPSALDRIALRIRRRWRQLRSPPGNLFLDRLEALWRRTALGKEDDTCEPCDKVEVRKGLQVEGFASARLPDEQGRKTQTTH